MTSSSYIATITLVLVVTSISISTNEAHAIQPEVIAVRAVREHAKWSLSRIKQCSRSEASTDQCKAVMRSYVALVHGQGVTMDRFEACVRDGSPETCSKTITTWGLYEWIFLPIAVPLWLFAFFVYLFYLLPLMLIVTLIKIPLFFLGITETWYLFIPPL